MINPGRDVTYQQIAADLRADIHAGRIPPGRRLPSETTLSQSYGVNRQTARRAVNLIRIEGLADLIRGAGLVVREQPERAELTPPAGSVVTSRMPTLDERQELALGEGVPLISVQFPDGSVRVYPADRWKLIWPAS